MNQPNWSGLTLEPGILMEPTADRGRVILWVPAERDTRFQYWERIASGARSRITCENGQCHTDVSSIKARQGGGLIGSIRNRLRGVKANRTFVIPGGISVEQCAEKRGGSILVWPEDEKTVLDQTRIEAGWPQAKRIQKLGAALFVVSGLDASSPAAVSVAPQHVVMGADNPRAEAEAILIKARQSGARDREAMALTDLAVLALNEGKSQEAIALLEQALPIATELGDRVRQSDVIGSLGMAMLAVRQPQQAYSLFSRVLDQARADRDVLGEKSALERLGLAAWHLRDFNRALDFFEQALARARQVGDRHQEANLLWHQGIQHAELGQRGPAIARAEESIALFRSMGRPQAAAYGAYLQKYRMGLDDEPSLGISAGDRSAGLYLGGATVASVMAGASPEEPSRAAGSGPKLLRMALSATKAMANFAGSGFKTVSPELQHKRLQTCTGCEHYTGVRCRICGCFINVKSRMVHEDCPIGKWPS